MLCAVATRTTFRCAATCGTMRTMARMITITAAMIIGVRLRLPPRGRLMRSSSRVDRSIVMRRGARQRARHPRRSRARCRAPLQSFQYPEHKRRELLLHARGRVHHFLMGELLLEDAGGHVGDAGD